MSRIVILGGGTAGTIMANRLRRVYAREIEGDRMHIVVVDEDDDHLYQPGLLFLPFGESSPRALLRRRRPLLRRGVEYRRASVASLSLTDSAVKLTDGSTLRYDALIIATGAQIIPSETEGLTGPGWGEKTHEFYTLAGSMRLRNALSRFKGGRVVIDIVEMPIKCPVAPLEFAFLADAYFTRRGIRDRVSLTYVTPLDSAFTKATCARYLGGMLSEKGIELVTQFNAGRVDGEHGVLQSWDEREVPFDLLVTVPLHMGAEFVGQTPELGDDMRFVRTDPHTLQSLASPNVFAIGDATNLPASKAGSVAHFEAEVLTENVRRFLAGQPLEAGFDGHANCFIESGFDKALLIDFNYDVEPLPGRFPFAIGPLKLLEESRLNHLGKLAFRWVYWHVLLPGRDIPFVGARMSMRGKHLVAPPPPPAPPTSPTPPAAPPSSATHQPADEQIPAGSQL
ncbi:MAG TPA: FAD/NAD(P)-binding oxidoreductase [Gemmatimonadaceae bacterium]